MGRFLVLILSALALVANLSGCLGNPNFTNILSNSIEGESNLASCLLKVMQDPSLSFMAGIGIGIETESTSFRRNFMDTLDGLTALKDKVAINHGSTEKGTTSIDGWLNFIDSVNALEILIKRQRNAMDNSSAAGQIYFIILPVNMPHPERVLKQIFELCWNNYILNVNVFVEDKSGTVTLYTYYPFSETNCRNTTPKIHNRFSNGHFEQNVSTFPSKTRNLWQCPVRIIAYFTPPYFAINKEQISGPDINIFKTLAKLMNFSLEFVLCSEQKGEVYSNGTTSGCMKRLVDGLGDLMIATSTKTRHEFFSSTIQFYFFSMFSIIKRFDVYSPLEILLLPFDWYTWIAIFVLVIGKWISQLLRRRISHDSVSLSETFKRYTLTLWLFGMLILSSSYGGSIFGFLHNRPSKPLPKSLQEAHLQGYTFIVSENTLSYVKDISELKSQIITFGNSDAETLKYFVKLQGKYAFINYVDLFYSSIDTERHAEFFFIKERLTLNYVCFYMPKSSYLTMDFSRHLGNMIANGYAYKIYTFPAPRKLTKNTLDAGPKSMTFNELSGQFQLLIILTVINIGVFLLELLSRYSRRLRRILEFLN